MKKNYVVLTDKHRAGLKSMLKKSSLKPRTYKRVIALLELDRGKTYKAVSESLDVCVRILPRLANLYSTIGLDCLYDQPRPGRPIKVNQSEEDQIVLLSCSEPPKGYSQWSLRLIADKMVELGHCDEISHTQVGNVLKKRKLNLT